MNWDQIAGNWKQFEGKVQQQWGKLTSDGLQQVRGDQKCWPAKFRSVAASPRRRPNASSRIGLEGFDRQPPISGNSRAALALARDAFFNPPS
jgi:uncharacterized protein YjbJ (UPF0337 family)